VKIKIGTKLILSFLVVLIFTGFIGFFGLNQASKINDNANDVANNWMRKQRLLGEMNGANGEYRIYLLQYIYATNRGDVARVAEYEERLGPAKKSFDDTMAETEQYVVFSAEGKKLFAQIKEAWKEVGETDGRVIDLVKTGRIQEAIALVNGESRDKYNASNETLKDFMDFNKKWVDQLNIENEAAYNANRITSITVILSALIIGFGLAIYISRGISKPTALIAETAMRIADGDLTVQELKVKSRDEIRDMADAFNRMLTNLKNMITQINATSQSVAATSEELSSNSEEASKATQQVAQTIEQVAKGSNNQAASVTEIVKAMDQMDQAIQQVASGAGEQSKNAITTTDRVNDMVHKIDMMADGMKEVKQVAEQNGEVAENGGKSVEKTVNGMLKVKEAVFDSAKKIAELGEQSQKIGEIIQVIDDIAEQTNLLALNAAIEAARAGEHGKGFAVVADEVRKLAERSGKATKEIADLITNIQRGTKVAVESMEIGTKEVEEGVTLARDAGYSLNEIITGVENTRENVNRIMGVINDILAGSQEVSDAINNVAAITEENTAATEEMAASTQQVNSAIQNVVVVSEENASSAEEVSASTEELTASIEEISASSEQLAKMAQELSDMVSQFRV